MSGLEKLPLFIFHQCPPECFFLEHSKGNTAPVSTLPSQPINFTFHIKYVNLPLNQCRDPPEIFTHMLLIYCFFFYLHSELLIMFQGLEESHVENKI